MIEISLLKALSTRENLEKHLKHLNAKTLSIESIEILKDYQRYFETHQTDRIDFGEFSTYFFLLAHPNLDDKKVMIYKEIISLVQNKPLEDTSCTDIIRAFEQQQLYNELHQDLDKNIDIQTIKLKIDTQYDKLSVDDQLIDPFRIDMDLNLAIDYTDRSKGLKWRLNSLRELFQGGLIKGDFGIIAGYIDMGKTGFICSEISYMAEQLSGNQWICWLNGEGNWEQILGRIYQAALNCTKQDLTKFTNDAIIKYTDLMKGDKNRIRVLNSQRMSVRDIENLIKKNPPSLIIFDPLDQIRGFDKYVGKDGNSTERYNALYQWARTIATEVCPVLGISQLNGDGNNEPYPSITNLRGSRVDKQAAATFQLIIGGMEGNSTERYLSMPKNKVTTNKGWRIACKFDPLRTRFSD